MFERMDIRTFSPGLSGLLYFGFIALLLVCGLPVAATLAQSSTGTWQSEMVFKSSPDGPLVYISDEEGNRIPDFSHAGYRGGGVELPYIPEVIRLAPLGTSGDAARIQQALDEVGAMEADENGHRGAVVLEKGVWLITEPIEIRHSGVVLRGEGSGSDPAHNTVLNVLIQERPGNLPGDIIGVIKVGTGQTSWGAAQGSPIATMVTPFVPVGSRHVELSDASGFSVGDQIVLRHPSTQTWIEAIDYGTGYEEESWIPAQNGQTMAFKRTITAISGNVIGVDAPIFSHLDQQYFPEDRPERITVYKADVAGLIYESGVESLRVLFNKIHNQQTDGVVFDGVKNGWVDNVAARDFIVNSFSVRRSRNVTVQNSRAEAESTPGIPAVLRYNFNATYGNATGILFTGNYSEKSRRDFSVSLASVSGVVFHNSESWQAGSFSEGHRWWSTGLLFDNLTFRSSVPPQYNAFVALTNRGLWGTMHGWANIHSVIWNNDLGSSDRRVVVQKPPTGQNYAIAIQGSANSTWQWPGPPGFIEGTNQTPAIPSLYEAQLHDRLVHGIPPDAPARLSLETDWPSFDQDPVNHLSWSHVAIEEMEFVIERSVNGAPFEERAVIPSTQTEFTDDQVGFETYRYRVAARNNGRYSAWSNEASADYSLSFDLRFPGDGTRTELSGLSTRQIAFWWNEVDVEYQVSYHWMLDRADGDFSEPVHVIETDANVLPIDHVKLDDILAAAGVDSNAVFEGRWSVNALIEGRVFPASDSFDIVLTRGAVDVSVEELSGAPPGSFELSQNYPNPFNPGTMISYRLPSQSPVLLQVFDMQGRVVSTLVSAQQAAGNYQVYFDAGGMASGMYFYRLQTNHGLKTRSMMLIR